MIFIIGDCSKREQKNYFVGYKETLFPNLSFFLLVVYVLYPIKIRNCDTHIVAKLVDPFSLMILSKNSKSRRSHVCKSSQPNFTKGGPIKMKNVDDHMYAKSVKNDDFGGVL